MTDGNDSGAARQGGTGATPDRTPIHEVEPEALGPAVSSAGGDHPEAEGQREAPAGEPCPLASPRPPDAASRPAQGGVAATGSERLPGDGWDRYAIGETIGAGGMGAVVKAWDPRLQRTVALKFLRSDDPDQVQRFLKEAQAQARVEHEHVCKVYEVGEVDGRPFIAMQYLKGSPLGAVAPRLSLEEKIIVMKNVAEAVHAAHRLGLIHRDLKPANIMLEKDEDGAWHPFVVDFGLAREVAEEGLTTTGCIVGTPAYMAPEQVLGSPTTLDRRTDVYALGATLYEAVTGSKLFAGEMPMQIMMRILNEEPVRPRKLEPSCPVDIETVILKCVEKEPHRRYDSARALADDLQRFLDGEPVRARRGGWLYRTGKKIQRNKKLAAVVAVAALLSLSLGGAGLRASWLAKKRAVIAQRFGQQVKEMESIMRHAHMMPLHDTGREEAMVRQRMERLGEEMAELGRAGRGPGNYALGIASLALREPEQAVDFLRAAWNDEYRSPEVGFALGKAMGDLYVAALADAARIENEAARQARMDEIEARYLEPAKQYLETARGGGVASPAFVEGLVAYYGKDYDEALVKAGEALAELPWLYEAVKLEADIRAARGREEFERGAHDKAAESFARARDALDGALAIGRSDPSVHVSSSRLWLASIRMEMALASTVSQSAVGGAMQSCESALVARPEYTDALVAQAQLWCTLAEHRSQTGDDPAPAFAAAVAAAERALAIDPGHVEAHNTLGQSLWCEGQYVMRRGLDPISKLDRAVATLAEALRLDPNNSFVSNNLAVAYAIYGLHELRLGRDPRPRLERAVAQYSAIIDRTPMPYPLLNRSTAYNMMASYAINGGEDPRPYLENSIGDLARAAVMNPNNAIIFRRLGTAHDIVAEYEMGHGIDAGASLQDALEAYRRSEDLNPGNAAIHFNLGMTRARLGEYRALQGLDAREDFRAGEASYRKSLGINPTNPDFHNNIGVLYQVWADYEARHGRDPRPLFQRAVASFARGLELSAGDPYLQAGLAWTHVMVAEYQTATGADPRRRLQRARPLFAKATQTSPDVQFIAAGAAMLDRVEGDWLERQGQDPGPSLQRARISCARAAELSAGDPDAAIENARIELIAARHALRARKPARESLRVAGERLRSALDLNPQSSEILAELAQLQLLRALAGDDPRVMIDGGLDAAEQALEITPDNARAELFACALTLLRSRTANDPAVRAEADNAAAAHRARALAGNPLLEADLAWMEALIRARAGT